MMTRSPVTDIRVIPEVDRPGAMIQVIRDEPGDVGVTELIAHQPLMPAKLFFDAVVESEQLPFGAENRGFCKTGQSLPVKSNQVGVFLLLNIVFHHLRFLGSAQYLRVHVGLDHAHVVVGGAVHPVVCHTALFRDRTDRERVPGIAVRCIAGYLSTR